MLPPSHTAAPGRPDLPWFDRPEVPDHALHRAAALLQELRDVDGERRHPALADRAEQGVGDASGYDEEGLGAAGGRVGEGVRGVARGVVVADLDQALAETLAQAAHRAGLEGGAPGEEEAAARAEGTQGGVAVVVSLQDELDAQDLAPGPDDLLEQRLDARVGAEAVDALPGWDRERRHEALAQDAPVRQQHQVPGREEVGLALEAKGRVEL